MTRLTRLTNILLHLQSRRVITAQELADKFGITQRTVYRDIRTLEEAGVPVIGEVGKGYSLMEGYKIPPMMFSQQEINALLTAHKLLKSMISDQSTYKNLENVIIKIKAIIRNSEKEKAEKLENRIYVYSGNSSIETEHLSKIQIAIADCNVLYITYHSINENEVTQRQVEPLAVYYTNGNWIMIAFCKKRDAIRQFRIDRINNLTATTETFQERQFSLSEYFSSIYQN